jgi:Flp pilus assembly protein TadG
MSFRRHRADGGQATVEFVLVLPVLVALLLAVVQVAVLARAQISVGAAAREATRAAAVGEPVSAAYDAAEAASGLARARLDVRIDHDGAMVTARVSYRDDTTIPLVGRLTGPVTLRSTVVMRRER